MTYFVTGATGFIGRHLVSNLLKRKGDVHVLVRKQSQGKLKELVERMGWDAKRVIAVTGDLSKPKLGISVAQMKSLQGKIKHVFHLAAVYDLAASAEAQVGPNVDGTRHAVQFAESVAAKCFHHTSSIAVAGYYSGVFREDMFDEAENLDHPFPHQARVGKDRA